MKDIDSSESPERVRLRELESENKWVFHGSGVRIEELEPRQAHSYPDAGGENKIPDGDPAVYASPLADVAIFMAIFNKQNAPAGARSAMSGYENGEMKYRTTQETMDQIHNARGYIHVFSKDTFTPRSFFESLSHIPVRPEQIIEITEKDLPNNIEVTDF